MQIFELKIMNYWLTENAATGHNDLYISLLLSARELTRGRIVVCLSTTGVNTKSSP